MSPRYLLTPFLLLSVMSAWASIDAEKRAIDLAQQSLISHTPWPRAELAAHEFNAKIIALRALHENSATTRPEDAFLAADQTSPALILASGAPGSRCENAMPLSAGQPFAYRVAPNAAIWFRIVSPAESITLLDTVGSHADTALEVYRHCQGALVASADDTYGLQARLNLPKQANSRTYFVRLRSFGSGGMQAMRLQLRAGAVVSGRVQRSTNASLPMLAVRFFDAQRNYLGSDFTDAAGNYELAVPETVGNIYLRTQKLSAPESWLNSIYPAGICRDLSSLEACVFDQAQLVPTAPNTVTDLAPMTLLEGATLEGNVLRPNSNGGGSVHGLSAIGVELFSTSLDAVGRYRIVGLYPETVRIYARATGANSAVHPNLPCTGPNFTECPLAQATPVDLQIGTSTRIDFSLQPASGIDLQLPPGVQRVDVFRADGLLAATHQWGIGTSLFVPLAAGNYRVRLTASNFFASIWPSTDCIFPCLDELQSAPPFAIAAGEIKPLQFTLRRLPSIRVSLRDALTQLPITNGESQLLSNFSPPPLTTTGGVALHTNVEPGHYYVRGGSLQHIDQAAPGVVCELFSQVATACPGAQRIVVDLNSPEVIEVAFNLGRSGAVEGLSPVHGVQALNSSALPVAYGGNQVNFSASQYRLVDLTPGQYLFGLAGFGYFPQLYANVNCDISSTTAFSLCTPAIATSVQINAGETVSGINFSPRSRSAIRGTLVNGQTGAPIAGVILDFWQVLPNLPLRVVYSVRSDADGKFEAPLSAPAWISTDQALGFSNAVYPNVPCANGSAASGGCSVTAGQAVNPDTSIAGSGVLFALQPVLFQHGFEN